MGIWEKCPKKIKGNQTTSLWKAFRVSHFLVKIWTLVSCGKGLWFIWMALGKLVAFQLELCRKAHWRNRGGRGWLGHKGWDTDSQAGLPSLSSLMPFDACWSLKWLSLSPFLKTTGKVSTKKAQKGSIESKKNPYIWEITCPFLMEMILSNELWKPHS